MNATLGVELPFTTAVIQTTIPLGYIDPATEIFQETATVATKIGTAGDGTQLWKFTHNGVDSHGLHFHLFNVQLVNRIGWDGAIKPPNPNELGWKETVIMNPLEDIVIAFRPFDQILPFVVPNSKRPFDVTQPIGSTMGFTNVSPADNTPITVVNRDVNFGAEYVTHCHLLGHEENDMMRPMMLALIPNAPTNLVAQNVTLPRRVRLDWTSNSTGITTRFKVQRATNAAFTSNLRTFYTSNGEENNYRDATVGANHDVLLPCVR